MNIIFLHLKCRVVGLQILRALPLCYMCTCMYLFESTYFLFWSRPYIRPHNVAVYKLSRYVHAQLYLHTSWSLLPCHAFVDTTVAYFRGATS